MSSAILKFIRMSMIIYMAFDDNSFVRGNKHTLKVTGYNTNAPIQSATPPSSKLVRHTITDQSNIQDVRVAINPSKYSVFKMTVKPTLKIKTLGKHHTLKSVLVKTDFVTLKNDTANQTQERNNSVSASTADPKNRQLKKVPLFTSRLFTRISHNIFGIGNKNLSSNPENGLSARLVRVYSPMLQGFHRIFLRRRPFGNFTDKNDTLVKIVVISNEIPSENNLFQPFFDFFQRMTLSIKSFLHSVK